jgi:hypothetical protein
MMPSQPLPAELQEFLAKHIDSIAQLEALLLLREGLDVVWDVQTIAKRLYIGEQEAEEVVGLLTGHGFIVLEESGYRYRPQSQELARMVDVLAEYYRRYLIPITNLVHAKPRRIRQFADAFKLRKE